MLHNFADGEINTGTSIEDLGQLLTVKVCREAMLQCFIMYTQKKFTLCPLVYLNPEHFQEWRPPARIFRGTPLRNESDDSNGKITDPSAGKSRITALFAEFHKFGSFSWSDDSTSEGTEEEEPGDDVVDLVEAGVFKKSLDILLSQPRCVLCSVCFKAGDKVCFSNNPSCEHEYHKECILQWFEKKSSTSCPVCKESYIKGNIQ